MTTLEEAINEHPEPVSHSAAVVGLIVASKEAAQEYGDPENYPEPLKKFLDRCVEVAEEFINLLGLEDM